MRKRTIRNGLRLVLAALLVIIITSYYHDIVGVILSLSYESEMRFYRLGIFWAAAMGSYGVVLAAFGLVLSGNQRDYGVRIMPAFLMVIVAVVLFFYLLAASINAPVNPQRDRLRPGDTITI